MDVEYLQKLAYDRSITWTSFFDNYENNETIARLEDIEDDVDIKQIGKYFSSADDDLSDDLASMEDDYDDDVEKDFLKNASKTSQLSLFLGNTALDLTTVSKNEEEKQYVDVINKTLPILHEHKRQLQEFGFDKTLISFKKNEIDKFGSWLNRHNSLFGGDSTLLYQGKIENSEPQIVAAYRKTKMNKPCIEDNEMDSDSDGSLQSGETARYIRSSKLNSAKNSATTMIKTYRMVSRTREALREKYACETDEEDYRRNTLRIRKKLGRNKCHNHYITPMGKSSIKNERVAFTTGTHKRKVLRKRLHNNNCNVNYSSSDSEYYENYQKAKCKNLLKSCCNRCNRYNTPLSKAKKILKARTKLTSTLRNRLYYLSRSMSLSSSTSTPFNTPEERKTIRSNARFVNNDRPSKRESDCFCFNGEELCEKFKHVADTSTEEWYVENGCIPTSPTKAKRKNEKNKYNLKENKIDQAAYDKKQQKKPKKESRAQENDKSKPTKSNKRLLKIKESVLETDGVDKKLKVIRDLTRPAKKSHEETFFAPKQNQAICNSTALSTEGHAYKRQFADAEQIIVIDGTTSEDTTMINLTQYRQKAKSAGGNLKENGATGISLISTTIRSPDLLMSMSEESKQKKQGDETTCDDQSDCSAHVTSTTIIEMPISQAKNKEVEKPLQQNHRILNSNKELTKNKVAEKPLQQKHRLLNSNEELTKNKVAEKPLQQKHRLLNSNEELTKNKVAENPLQQKHRLLNSNEELTRNCVLVYAPDKRHTIPANSFTPDGYFTVTQEHLSTLIGERAAMKFLKYYIGVKLFKLDSIVYYKPPSNSSLQQSLSSSSESTDDLDCWGQYGDLFALTK